MCGGCGCGGGDRGVVGAVSLGIIAKTISDQIFERRPKQPDFLSMVVYQASRKSHHFFARDKKSPALSMAFSPSSFGSVGAARPPLGFVHAARAHRAAPAGPVATGDDQEVC